MTQISSDILQLLAPQEHPDTHLHESMIAPHNFPVVHDGLQVRPDFAPPAWVFIALLLLVALMGLLFRLRNIKMGLLLKSAVDLRAMDRLVRDCNLNRTFVMLPMALQLVAGVCLPIHQTQLPQSGILGYMILCAAVALLYILRNGLLRLLGNTFDKKQEMTFFITSNYLYHLIEATAVTALLFLYFYLPGGRATMTWILVACLAIGFLTRFFRGVKIFFSHPNSSCFYLFYYLCIVEAIPILVALKWFFVQ